MTQLATLAPSAKPPVAAGDATEQGQYLIFTLAGETLAIGILHIKEIIEYGDLTEVPMMPQTVRGVINLRGAVVPVIDLSARFGKRATAVAKRTCIVIVQAWVKADSRKRQTLSVARESRGFSLDK